MNQSGTTPLRRSDAPSVIMVFGVDSKPTSDGIVVDHDARYTLPVAVHPGGGNALPNISQETRLGVGDVMVVIGDARIVQEVPIQGIEETSDSRYLSVEFVLADIVLAEGGSGVLAELTAKGILLREAIRNGRVLSECHFSDLKAGDVLKVVGLSRPVKAFAESRGYLKNDGSPSDFFMITFALAYCKA